MSDNINTSMNFIYGKVETHAPVVASAPRTELSMDTLATILSFLKGVTVKAVASGSKSSLLRKAAAASTISKKIAFKESVQKMIAVLKEVGAEKQVVYLTGLLSEPVFSNPGVMFSDKLMKMYGDVVLSLISTLDNPTLFALKKEHKALFEGFGLTTKERLVKMLLNGTKFEVPYAEGDKMRDGELVDRWDIPVDLSENEEEQIEVCAAAANAFLEVKDYASALTCASMVFYIYDKEPIVAEIINSLTHEECTIEKMEGLINSMDDEYIISMGKIALVEVSLERRNYIKAVTIADTMTSAKDHMALLDGIFDVMKQRGVSKDAMRTYFQDVSREVDGPFKPKFLSL